MRKAVVALSVALCGCANFNGMLEPERLASVKPGMGMAEVEQTLGAPKNRQFEKDREAWQYCQKNPAKMEHPTYIIVHFRSGRLTEMRTYTDDIGWYCTTQFKTIVWEDKPDLAVEVRKR